jgi:hypothetical protein
MIRDNRKADKRILASLREEAKLLCDLGRCQHGNIIRLLGICFQNGKYERNDWTCSPMDSTETRTPLDSPTGLVGAHTRGRETHAYTR